METYYKRWNEKMIELEKSPSREIQAQKLLEGLKPFLFNVMKMKKYKNATQVYQIALHLEMVGPSQQRRGHNCTRHQLEEVGDSST
ncbi:hypothetical protein K8353_44205, partial [Burkholderia contaminans]|nr:hypothetical protein [Burkholderia contaminans]